MRSSGTRVRSGIFTLALKSTGAILSEIFPVEEGDKSHENYVVLPCDFITDVSPQVFIEVYRGNSDENIGLSLFYNNIFEAVDKKVLRSNYTVYSNQENGNMVLLDMYSKDFVTVDKFLKIRSQLLWRYPSTLVSTTLLDSFIFFMSGRCRQHSVSDIQPHRPINKIKRDLARNSWQHSDSKSTIGLFALPQNALFVRCNNLPVYMEMNRYFLRDVAKLTPTNTTTPTRRTRTPPPSAATASSATTASSASAPTSSEASSATTCTSAAAAASPDASSSTASPSTTRSSLKTASSARRSAWDTGARLRDPNVEGSYTVGKNVNLKGETLKNISLDELSDGVLYESESDDTDPASSAVAGSDSESFDDEGFEEEEYDDDIFTR